MPVLCWFLDPWKVSAKKFRLLLVMPTQRPSKDCGYADSMRRE